MTTIYAYIVHKDGVADDSALELISAAHKIDNDADITAIVTGTGSGMDSVCQAMAASYKEVIKIDHADLAYPNAEIVRKALVAVIPSGSIVLVPHTTFGMDLSPGLSIKLDVPFLADVVEIEGIEQTTLKAVRQEYGGQVSTHVSCDISSGAVINIRPGPFTPDESKSVSGSVVDKSAEVTNISASRRYLETNVPEAGDVDITKSDVLVSIGRGIGDEENIDLANELAEAMGAVVSCSRPIVDAKWLDKARQVGTSGKTVKPKIYLALGISGSFQHLGGLKGSPFIVAVNKNPKAPIFQVADVGIVADILEFIPELTDKVANG